MPVTKNTRFPGEPKPVRRRLNATERIAYKAAAIMTFVQGAGQKAGKNGPKDRSYDRDVEAKVKRMPAEELDRLLREDEA